jgi:hypothetical protein
MEKDKLKYEFNVFTKQLDLVQEFNANRILTSEYLPNGNMRKVYDPETGFYMDAGPEIVFDNNGNVVVT